MIENPRVRDPEPTRDPVNPALLADYERGRDTTAQLFINATSEDRGADPGIHPPLCLDASESSPTHEVVTLFDVEAPEATFLEAEQPSAEGRAAAQEDCLRVRAGPHRLKRGPTGPGNAGQGLTPPPDGDPQPSPAALPLGPASPQLSRADEGRSLDRCSPLKALLADPHEQEGLE